MAEPPQPPAGDPGAEVLSVAEALQAKVETIIGVATRRVDRAAIAAFAVATRDPDPAYTDPEAARRSRWGGFVAAPTFVGTITGEDKGAEWTGFGSGSLNGGERYELLRPVRVDEVVTAVERVESVRGVVGRSGAMLIVVRRIEYRDSDGELLARRWGTTIRR